MEKLIELVAAKTGLPPDRARTAVETVLTHLKGRLPAPLAEQIDKVLSGGPPDGLDDLVTDQLGGMFGKQP